MWKLAVSLFGLPVEEEPADLPHRAVITWALASTMVLVSTLVLLGAPGVVGDFGFLPQRPLRYGGITFVASFFLHGGWWHLLSNVYFLIVFGDDVECCLGRRRYLLLIVAGHLAGALLHLALDPRDTVPLVGASAGLSAVLAFYAVRFPMARLVVFLRSGLYPLGWVRLDAGVAFLVWVAVQVLGAIFEIHGYGGVSYLGHLGGTAAGIAVWLVWSRPHLTRGVALLRRRG